MSSICIFLEHPSYETLTVALLAPEHQPKSQERGRECLGMTCLGCFGELSTFYVAAIGFYFFEPAGF